MQHQPSHFSFGSSNVGKCKHHRSSDMCLWDFLKLMVVSTILYHLCRWIILLCSFVQAIGKTGSVPCIFVVAVLFWCCALVLERQCKKLQSRSARHGRGLVWLLWRMSAVWSYTLPFSRDVKGNFHKSLCFFFNAPLSNHDWSICPKPCQAQARGGVKKKALVVPLRWDLFYMLLPTEHRFFCFFNLYVLIHFWGLCLTSQAAGLFPQGKLEPRIRWKTGDRAVFLYESM